MTDEELKEHRTLERAFLHSKEKRNLFKKRIKIMQKIIDDQNEVIQRKDHYIKKCLEQIEKMKNCHNCKHSFHNGGHEEKCQGCWKYESKKDFQADKKTYLHWELA